MSTGQRTANRLNQEADEEEQKSILQRHFKNSPMSKVGVGMGKMGIAAASGGLDMISPMAAPALTAATMGLMKASGKRKEDQQVIDFKSAEGFHRANSGKTKLLADPFRSVNNSITSMSNPMMAASMGAGLLDQTGLAGSLMTGSMMSRSPMMALQAAGGMGLTSALAGASNSVGNKAIGGITDSMGGGAAGAIGLGSSLLPATMMYGASGALKGAGGLASMLGADKVGEGLAGAAGGVDAGAGGLLKLIAGAADLGGPAALLGPGLGMLTSMALRKPMGKAMGWAKEKATGVEAQKKGKSISARLPTANEIEKKWSKATGLKESVRSGIGAGIYDPFQSMNLMLGVSRLEALAPLMPLYLEVSSYFKKQEIGSARTEDSMQSKLGLKGDDDDDLTSVYEDEDKRGVHNMAFGDVGLTSEEFWKDPGKYIKSTVSSAFLGVEKTVLQASAIADPISALLGGLAGDSIGTKLKKIREKDNKDLSIKAMSKFSGISVQALSILETTSISLADKGQTVTDKILSVLMGSFEVARAAASFLLDIRKAMGVTRKNSMTGKLKEIREGTEEAADTRTDRTKRLQAAADIVDLIPGISILGTAAGAIGRLISRQKGEVTNEADHVDRIAEEALRNDPTSAESNHDLMIDLYNVVGQGFANVVGNLSRNGLYIRQMIDCTCDDPEMLTGSEGVSITDIINQVSPPDPASLLASLTTGSADATDAAIVADREEDEEISREDRMLKAVLSIEKLLKECCGGGSGGPGGLGGFDFERRERSGLSSTATTALTGAAGGAIALGTMNFLRKITKAKGLTALMGISSASSGASVKMLSKLGLEEVEAEIAGTAIDFAMMGSIMGWKGMLVGGITGLVYASAKTLIDKFIDPKEKPVTNSLATGLTTVITGAMAGFAMGGPLGAMAGAVGALAWHYKDELMAKVKGETKEEAAAREKREVAKKAHDVVLKKKAIAVKKKEKDDWVDPNSKMSQDFEQKMVDREKTLNWYKELRESGAYDKLDKNQKLAIMQKLKQSGMGMSSAKEKARWTKRKEDQAKALKVKEETASNIKTKATKSVRAAETLSKEQKAKAVKVAKSEKKEKDDIAKRQLEAAAYTAAASAATVKAINNLTETARQASANADQGAAMNTQATLKSSKENAAAIKAASQASKNQIPINN